MYDPQRVITVFAGIQLFGYAEGTFIKAANDSDGFMKSVGADGDGARTMSADKSGTVEVTLAPWSECNELLTQIYKLDRKAGAGVGVLMIKDLTTLLGLVHAENAWIKKMPDFERAKAFGSVTWVFESINLDIQQGTNSRL